MLLYASVGSYGGACGIRLHLVMTNLFLDKMGKLVDFIDKAPGLVGFIHPIGCRVGHRLLILRLILLLDLCWCLIIALLPVVFLAVMSPSVSSRSRRSCLLVGVVDAALRSSPVGWLFGVGLSWVAVIGS